MEEGMKHTSHYAALSFAFFVLLSVVAQGAVSGVSIGIDARDGFSAATVFATGSNFATYRATISSMGDTLVPLSNFDAANLIGLQALILKQPYTSNGSGTGFSPSEINAIHAFVAAGGGLVFHADGGGNSDSLVSNINTLVAPYGITYASTATEGSGYTITGFVPHPVTNALNSIGVDFQRREMNITAPAIDLTVNSGPDNALAALNGNAGSGNAVFLSDTSMFTDPGSGSDRDITFGDNQRLVMNYIDFITEPTPEPNLAAIAVLLITVALLSSRPVRRRAIVASI
jgi:hypothetical protein